MENKKEKVNIEALKKNELLKSIWESNLVDEDGLRITGVGIIINKLDNIAELIDRTNLKIYGLGKEIEKLRNEK